MFLPCYSSYYGLSLCHGAASLSIHCTSRSILTHTCSCTRARRYQITRFKLSWYNRSQERVLCTPTHINIHIPIKYITLIFTHSQPRKWEKWKKIEYRWQRSIKPVYSIVKDIHPCFWKRLTIITILVIIQQGCMHTVRHYRQTYTATRSQYEAKRSACNVSSKH